jgi:NAD-dependent deacetylase
MVHKPKAHTPHPQLVQLLEDARRILLFTGTGISTGSGIPDFRGPQGVWKTRQPVYFQDFLHSEDARVEHWDFKLESWPVIRQARPTPTHRAIAALESADRVELVVTQNVDGLHARAGTSAERLVELHGSNAEIECLRCGGRTDPKPHMQRALAAASACDLVVALGSTLGVYPAANVPLAAVDCGTPYVIINQGATEHDDHHGITLRLDGDVQELFPAAVRASQENR